jgi:hypothetical protein
MLVIAPVEPSLCTASSVPQAAALRRAPRVGIYLNFTFAISGFGVNASAAGVVRDTWIRPCQGRSLTPSRAKPSRASAT